MCRYWQFRTHKWKFRRISSRKLFKIYPFGKTSELCFALSLSIISNFCASITNIKHMCFFMQKYSNEQQNANFTGNAFGVLEKWQTHLIARLKVHSTTKVSDWFKILIFVAVRNFYDRAITGFAKHWKFLMKSFYTWKSIWAHSRDVKSILCVKVLPMLNFLQQKEFLIYLV